MVLAIAVLANLGDWLRAAIPDGLRATLVLAMPPAWLRATLVLVRPPDGLRATLVLVRPPDGLRANVPNVPGREAVWAGRIVGIENAALIGQDKAQLGRCRTGLSQARRE